MRNSWLKNENNRYCKKISHRSNTLMKTKILAKFQVYIWSCSHFTTISSICYLYSVLSVKSSFCEHCPSKNSHSFKSGNDKAMNFGKNVSNMRIWICPKILFHQEGIDNFLLGGIHCTPPPKKKIWCRVNQGFSPKYLDLIKYSTWWTSQLRP